jgi:beta-lactamase class D
MRVVISMMIFIGMCILHQTNAQKKQEQDFKKYYDAVGMGGAFLLYDLNHDSYILYNPSQLNVPFSAASTFKIFNSMVGLETGVIQDENYVIKWDGVDRQRPEWNQDQDLKTAFKNSTIWYYQEIARRVGAVRMKKWLDDARYGNGDTTGGIDQFWLTGNFRVTPEEQIDFLKRFYKENLPFSKRSMDIVKKIMIADTQPGYVLRAKTGWGVQKDLNIGWYVGYLETKGNVYFFVNCVFDPTQVNPAFAKSRIDITYQIMNELGLMEAKK